MSYSNEHTLQDLLKRCYRRLEMDDTATELEVQRAYRQVVGDFINRLTWTVKFDKGVLRVELASAALKQELFYRRDSLATHINDALGRHVVNKIVFR